MYGGCGFRLLYQVGAYHHVRLQLLSLSMALIRIEAVGRPSVPNQALLHSSNTPSAMQNDFVRGMDRNVVKRNECYSR